MILRSVQKRYQAYEIMKLGLTFPILGKHPAGFSVSALKLIHLLGIVVFGKTKEIAQINEWVTDHGKFPIQNGGDFSLIVYQYVLGIKVAMNK